jgi:hypothetical protein
LSKPRHQNLDIKVIRYGERKDKATEAPRQRSRGITMQTVVTTPWFVSLTMMMMMKIAKKKKRTTTTRGKTCTCSCWVVCKMIASKAGVVRESIYIRLGFPEA